MYMCDAVPQMAVVVVLRVEDAWLVGIGKRAPRGFRFFGRSLLMARWIDSKLMHYFLYIEL